MNKTNQKELEALKELKEFYGAIYFNDEYIGDARIVKIEKGGRLKGKFKLVYLPALKLKGDRK